MARAAFTNLRPTEIAGIGLGLAGLYFAVRPCRDLPAVGAEDAQTEQAAQAAGEAARDRAAQSHWPPTKGDIEAIGSVAGAAAGTVFGGPVGGAIGAAVGGFVGGVAYDIIDAIPSAGDNPVARMMVRLRQGANARVAVLDKLAESCGTNRDSQWKALLAWGAEPYCAEGSDCRRDWANHVEAYGEASANALMTKKDRRFFEAAAAQTAVCEVKRHSSVGSPKGGGGGGIVLAATGLGALALWALL